MAGVVRVARTRQVDDFLARLRAYDEDLWVETVACIRYLLDVGAAAVLPQVRFGIAQSKHRDTLGEIRAHLDGRDEFVRILFALHDNTVVLLVAGDKGTGSHTGNAWYDHAVPLADTAYDNWLTNQPPSR